ncbi:helix-turn-helix domain-containing protein [Budvicia diplopodorum]|uniref:helix-turn-helix domain-containing protein n=1 Tax=Budvicia diplopodorum TaxID=1119056 RepID=UPI0013596853|nr:helix-turn-helix domain-containing protein [Budvicia diplopodorum]
MTTFKILRSKEDHDEALVRMAQLMASEPEIGTEKGDELEILALLVEDYERKNHPIDKPSPIEAIKYLMDKKGLSQSDMTRYLGSKSKVSEVLNGKRALSISMIRKLHHELGIPADILIQDMNSIDWELANSNIEPKVRLRILAN